MNPAEFEAMAAVEAEHWWFWALRDILTRTLAKPGFRLPSDAVVLDAGCGSGENLRHLGSLYPSATFTGFDCSEIALDLARRKSSRVELYQSDIRDPELRGERCHLILSCDVLPAPGLEASRAGLTRLVEHLRPEGLFVLNLPAYGWLVSEHDLSFHQHERYTAGVVRRLLVDLGLHVSLVTYRVCALFPAVVMSRLPSLLSRRPRPEYACSQSALPGAAVNALLRTVQQVENAFIASGVRMPWGSSVFAVGRKPAT